MVNYDDDKITTQIFREDHDDVHKIQYEDLNYNYIPVLVSNRYNTPLELNEDTRRHVTVQY